MGLVQEIMWIEDGWFVVMPERYSGVSQLEVSNEYMVGNYEIITMSYNCQTIQKSSLFQLNADGSVRMKTNAE